MPILSEHRPLDERRIHGVTFDGAFVWFALDDELVAFDPKTERVVRRFALAGASAGTAFDGERLYQMAKDDVVVVDKETGAVLRRFPVPVPGDSSGMSWGDGRLFVGQFRGAKIHEVEPATGAILTTRASDRWVTGVSCFEGAVWHAASYDGKPPELRRLARDGTVEERFAVAVDEINGIECTAQGFWCGGSRGTLRLVGRG
jgi:outer membrane protein assembly factor BamB